MAAVAFLGLRLNFRGIFFPPVGERGSSDSSSGLSGGSSGGDSSAGDPCQWASYRLPDTVVPQSYNLSIEADLQPPRQVTD